MLATISMPGILRSGLKLVIDRDALPPGKFARLDLINRVITLSPDAPVRLLEEAIAYDRARSLEGVEFRSLPLLNKAVA
jgi:hypothetical protein